MDSSPTPQKKRNLAADLAVDAWYAWQHLLGCVCAGKGHQEPGMCRGGSNRGAQPLLQSQCHGPQHSAPHHPQALLL